MTIFGGEEVSGLVFDFGSSISKVGFAGDDAPHKLIPSYIGSIHDSSQMDLDTKTPAIMGENNLYLPKQGLELSSPFDSEGLVSNWDEFENLWEYTYEKALRVQSSEHPVMFIDPSWDSKANREKLCELAFEKFGVPGFYLGRSAVLSAFAAGRSTSLIIESGAATTSVVPVFDGYIVRKAIQKAQIGGNFVSEQAKEYLKSINVDLTPSSMIKSKQAVDSTQPPVYEKKDIEVTESWENYAIEQTIRDFKETIVHVPEQTYNDMELRKRPPKNYEFPTGFSTTFNVERFRIGETLFQNNFSFNPNSQSGVTTIPRLIALSLGNSDIEIQTVLATNVVLTGANTLIHGFADRVYSELHKTSQGNRIKVLTAGGSNERKFGSWIGGSILSSLQSFHQLWISKQQYEETGVSCEKKIY